MNNVDDELLNKLSDIGIDPTFVPCFGSENLSLLKLYLIKLAGCSREELAMGIGIFIEGVIDSMAKQN
jgi:hypothetical protein